MGDLPEPPYARITTSASIMNVLTETLSRNTTLSKEYSEAIKILKVRLKCIHIKSKIKYKHIKYMCVCVNLGGICSVLVATSLTRTT